jgi:hypothetical protein
LRTGNVINFAIAKEYGCPQSWMMRSARATRWKKVSE